METEKKTPEQQEKNDLIQEVCEPGYGMIICGVPPSTGEFARRHPRKPPTKGEEKRRKKGENG